MQLDKKTIRSIFFGVAGCIILYWLLHETARLVAFFKFVWNLLYPFAVGAVIAFVLNVPMRRIEKSLRDVENPKLRRALAMILTFVLIVLICIGVVQLLLPQIAETVDKLSVTLPDFFYRMLDKVMAFLDENPEIMEWLQENTDFEKMDWSKLIEQAVSLFSNSMTSVVDVAANAVNGLFHGILTAFIGLVFALYCMSRKEILARQFKKVMYSFLPERFCDETVRIMRMANGTFSDFISGQCLEAVILGCMFAVTMLVLKMPYIPLVSVVIAVTALVPIVGAWVGCVVGAFFIMVDSVPLAVGFVIMFVILQQIENNLVYPRVVGTSIGLPGMWVLVAVTIGGDLMGVFGMLLFIPLTSVLYALAREVTDKRIEARGIPAEKLENANIERVSRFKENRQRKKNARLEALKNRIDKK